MSETAKTALIVGVRGLGRVIAGHFARSGWQVICAARTRETVDEVAAEVTRLGGRGLPIVCDLQDPGSLAVLAAGTTRLDLVVAAQTSGTRFGSRPLLQIDDAEIDQVLAAYVRGTWNLLKAIGPRLIAQGGGTYLQMGTSSGVRTREGWAPLGTAQHGLRALIQVAAREWRGHGVHVAYVPIDGGIAKGPVETPSRTISAQEIARACEYLHSQEPSAWTHELVLRPMATDWTAPT
jgi:NAD(P)-dependent dehydrogenase (short-subunit alcohol dehydrogenase family)